MEHGSATLCFRRACSSSCNGGRSHFPKTTRSMSLDRREPRISHNTPHQEVTSHVEGQHHSTLPVHPPGTGKHLSLGHKCSLESSKARVKRPSEPQESPLSIHRHWFLLHGLEMPEDF